MQPGTLTIRMRLHTCGIDPRTRAFDGHYAAYKTTAGDIQRPLGKISATWIDDDHVASRVHNEQ
jgi:hypothetical protein